MDERNTTGILTDMNERNAQTCDMGMEDEPLVVTGPDEACSALNDISYYVRGGSVGVSRGVGNGG